MNTRVLTLSSNVGNGRRWGKDSNSKTAMEEEIKQSPTGCDLLKHNPANSLVSMARDITLYKFR